MNFGNAITLNVFGISNLSGGNQAKDSKVKFVIMCVKMLGGV